MRTLGEAITASRRMTAIQSGPPRAAPGKWPYPHRTLAEVEEDDQVLAEWNLESYSTGSGK